ncbi:DUF6923 family protein [Hymenobacter aquaticus]|nr:T9SS type A sorting domain-containing protein [Hymenobacter aquaticus]
MAFSPQKAQAQAEGTAFSCDGTFYQIRQVGTGGAAFSALYVVNRATATYTTSVYTFGGTNATGNLGTVLNALGYNPQDGYMYAVTYPADNGTPNATTGIHLFRIGQGGIQDLGRTNLPLAQYNSGTFDKQGNYYLTTRNSTDATYRNTLFRLNLANFATVLTTHDQLPLVNSGGAPANDNFTDIGYNPSDNTLYSVARLGDVSRIVVGTTNAVVTPLSSGSASPEIFGSSFFDVSGNMYAYSNGTVGTANSAGFYSVDLQTGAATLISTIDAANNSDGASCINPDQRIDVVKDLISVTPTGTARQFDVRFNIQVKNTGTSTATNVQVTDFLGANGAFPTASTLAIQSRAITNTGANGGAAPTLAVSAAYNGQGTNADLLTGNQSLTAGQSALIDFTVRVTFPSNPGTPTTAQFNSAYASTISGTAANQGHIQLSNGDVLPPGNLLAQDQSTNTPSLPVTANGDTPSATPIRFGVSIQGTVFEDINYGGGLGRDQLTSQGRGISNVRVELYTAGGAFVNSTNTDADGGYVFTTTSGGAALAASTNYQVRVVNGSVTSTRPNRFAAAVAGVQTYIYNNNNQVGGADPNQIDVGPNTNNSAIVTLQGQSTSTIIQSLVTARTQTSGALAGVDFGFNFDTVVNTLDAGQGSLRQFIQNSSYLANDNLAQEGLTVGKEHAIFMINNGIAATGGLRGVGFASPGYNATTGVFTITLSSAAFGPMYDDNTVIDGKLQSNRTGETATATAGTSTGAEIAIDFNRYAGLISYGANTRIASVSLTNALGTGLNSASNAVAQVVSDAYAVTLSGANTAGSVITDVTATANFAGAVRLEANATGVTVSNNILRTAISNVANFNFINSDGVGVILTNASTNTISGNTIDGNAGYGIVLAAGGTNNTNTISGNTITANGAGTVTNNDAGIAILAGNNNLISANTITGNSGDGIVAMSGTSGNRFTQNNTGNNNGSGVTGNLGIDLSSNTTATGDGVSLNANGKTAASGANSLLNFPVFTQATITTGGNLVVSGYARAGALIEFFVASADPTNFGEGATYLFNATEGSAGDTDTRFASYTGGRTDLNHGSESGVSRFVFSIPVTAAQRTALVTNKLTATATVPATVNGLAVGNTSEFSGVITVVNNAPLPVELTSFEAKAVGLNARLTWATASEKNNDHFVVERAYGEQAFTPIATVQGAGTSTQAHSYSFVDAGVGSKNLGTVYYRLKQIDTDGTVNQGPVRTVLFETVKAEPSVFPNPTVPNQDAQLDLTSLPAGNYQVSVVDVTGRTLSTTTYAGGTLHPFAVRSLNPGSYLVVIRGGNVKITKRLVKN